MPTSSYDPTLFAGTAAYYQRYREPYDPAVVDILRRELDLDGAGRLLDVGTGTGNVVVPLAPLFDEAVGLDPDRDMLSEAAATAREAGVATVRWVPATAEQLPLSLGRFRTVTFAQSLHWMDRPRVVSTVYDMLEGGGAAVVVSQRTPEHDDADTTPWDDLGAVVRRYLGDERRAGSGTYRDPGPPQEAFLGSRFEPPQRIVHVSGHERARTATDVLGFLHSTSWAAPRLFGDRLEEFRAEVLALLIAQAPDGRFPYVSSDVEMLIYRA